LECGGSAAAPVSAAPLREGLPLFQPLRKTPAAILQRWLPGFIPVICREAEPRCAGAAVEPPHSEGLS